MSLLKILERVISRARKSSEVMTILSATLVTSHILIDQMGTFLRFTFSVGRSKNLHLLENTIKQIPVTA